MWGAAFSRMRHATGRTRSQFINSSFFGWSSLLIRQCVIQSLNRTTALIGISIRRQSVRTKTAFIDITIANQSARRLFSLTSQFVNQSARRLPLIDISIRRSVCTKRLPIRYFRNSRHSVTFWLPGWRVNSHTVDVLSTAQMTFFNRQNQSVRRLPFFGTRYTAIQLFLSTVRMAWQSPSNCVKTTVHRHFSISSIQSLDCLNWHFTSIRQFNASKSMIASSLILRRCSRRTAHGHTSFAHRSCSTNTLFLERVFVCSIHPLCNDVL